VDCFDPDCSAGPGCPTGCGEDPAFPVLACRLGSLRERTETATDDPGFLDDARQRLAKADAVLADAETTCAEGRRRHARRALKRLARQAGKYVKLVDSQPGRTAIADEAARDVLIGHASTIRGVAKALRRVVACPSS
jgi:hypothetical protein